MRLYRLFKPKTGKEIPFIILISLLLTFAFSRTITFIFPNIFFRVRSIHVHHFSYGIFLLAFIGYYSITQRRSSKTRLKLAVLYGIALGLALDEFAMWIQLEDAYYNRANFDAVAIVGLVLANIIYFDAFWAKWGYRLGKFFKRLIG